MTVAILGMHRSGTSLTAKLLKLCGFYLGDEADLVPADPNNADGYWEHRDFQLINDELLARHGGGWDAPPAFAPGWENAPALDPHRVTAEALIRRFPADAPWLWKDPRTTLTLPFWKTMVPDLKMVVCVRNPLEVALSLHRRGACSYPFALSLWRTYAEAVLKETNEAERIVVHYGALMQDAAGTLGRVLAGLGFAFTPAMHSACAAAFKPELRHARMSLANLHALAVAESVTGLYAQLCTESGFDDDGPAGTLTGDDRTLANIKSAIRHAADFETDASDPKAAYRRVVRNVKALVHGHLNATDIVAVMAKGDDALLKLLPAAAWHYPQDERGAYAGYHPAGALAAVAHLEVLKARGATHFLLPEPYAWWLQTYPGLRQHLDRFATLVEHRDGVGHLFALSSSRTEPDAADLLTTLADALGRTPQVLNWHAGDAVTTAFPQAHVFAPPMAPHCPARHGAEGFPPLPGFAGRGRGRVATSCMETLGPDAGQSSPSPNPSLQSQGGEEERHGVAFPTTLHATLPYLDKTIDVVAVAGDAAMLAEAARVATAAVIDMTAAPRVHWQRDVAATLPGVSIIIPVFNNWPVTKSCLKALFETLPVSPVEVIVVDDCSTDATPRELAAWAATEPRLKVLRHANNLGFVWTCNLGAAAALHEYLLFLNNDTVPLPGWLPPLVRTFDRFPDCGAVGGTLLHADGRLQEAGGIIFDDASACHFGRDEPDAAAPLFGTVRPVDYVSGALLLTPRRLFEQLHGFDTDYSPGYYEDADYCFRLREQGEQVYHQPASVVVHLEGATAGRDHSKGMKRHQEINRGRFATRHAAALALQTARPARIGRETWPALLRRGAS